MIPTTFRSILASHMNDFVAFKRLQGYDYAVQAKQLSYFDRFLAGRHFEQPYLTADCVNAYIKHTESFRRNTRYSRLSIVREFSFYLLQLSLESYLLRDVPVKRPNLPRYYLYDDTEILSLLQAARNLHPPSSIRPHTYYTLIGLLAVSGLRINEALSLDIGDIDLRDKLLVIRKGKFAKERILPFNDSTAQALHFYQRHRLAFGMTDSTDPFFVTRFGRRLSYANTSYNFRNLVQRCGIGCDSPEPPRLHDLRHSFATKCLIKWYREGQNVNAKLPILATYMGHVSIESTQIYLHVCSTLLAEAKVRFQNAFQLQT